MRDIKWSIMEEICKNREGPIMMEVNLDNENEIKDKEDINVEKEEIREEYYERLAKMRLVDWDEYEGLKRKCNKTNEEDCLLRKALLCYTYNYEDITDRELMEKVDVVDKNHQGFLRYLKGTEDKIKDYTDLEGPRLLRARYEELLSMLGFDDLFDPKTLTNREIKIDNEEEFIKKLKELQKKMNYKNLYRGTKINVKIIMNHINNIGKKLGLCIIKEKKSREGTKNLYSYKIDQNHDIKEVLKNMLMSENNKLNKKFNNDLVKKLGKHDIYFVDVCNWYLEGCLID
tara:strand:+ start:2015 stop:2875 length:861 start_codon:yes stop_codon:yes gene_type:complete